MNSIKKHKGHLKKGSTGNRVVYFTKLYTYSEPEKNGKKLQFSTYDQKKFKTWITKNYNRLQNNGWSIDRLANTYIPILKYYNVYHGAEITGIDFKKLPKNTNVDLPEKQRIEIAEKIVKNMPNAPKIIFGGDQPAYYPTTDHVQMTPIEAFNNEQSYYSTLFHELTHSTYHKKRLNDTTRQPNGKRTTKSRAFEELIAELGAVFLSAESGILFSTINNSSKYLAGWNSKLVTNMKKDNKFFFRASSKSQAASDYILDRDKNGTPKYLKDKSKPVAKKKPIAKIPTKKKPIVKKKPTKEQLEKVNPKPFSKKPKSVAIQTAIKDILSTGKYKNIKLLQASVLYSNFKNNVNNEEILTEYKKAILSKIDNYVDVGFNFYKNVDEAELTEHGKNFVTSITNRLESLKNQKNNYALFDNLKGGKQKPTTIKVEAEQSTLEHKGAANVQAPLIKGLKPVNVRNNNKAHEYYKINGNIAKLLGNIEIKPVNSVAITLDAPQGAGKTRAFFQFINEFASNGYKVLFVSAEEHPESSLFQKKLDQYIQPANQNNVFAIDSTNFNEISQLIPSFDIVFFDSWNKIAEKNKGIDFDSDLRKKFDSKLFFAIFQRTGTGTMRGGSKAQFDGDIILKIVKNENFKENYVIADKNRYTNEDIHEIKYNIFYQQLMDQENNEELPTTTDENVVIIIN